MPNRLLPSADLRSRPATWTAYHFDRGADIPIVAGTFTSTLTIYYTQYTLGNPGYAFCPPANGSATLVDSANSANTITKDESGQVCASSFGTGGSYTFIGSYTIFGGTGIYSGPNGTGTVNTYQPTRTSPFTGSEDGTINIPLASKDSCKNGGWMTFTNPSFTKAKLGVLASAEPSSRAGCAGASGGARSDRADARTAG